MTTYVGTAKKEANALKAMTDFWTKKGFMSLARACYTEIISSVLDDIDMVKFLMKEGVDLKAFDGCALKIAHEKGYKEVEQLLKNI